MCARLHQARHLKAGFEGLARPWRLSKSATEPCAKRRDRLRKQYLGEVICLEPRTK